MARTIYNSRGDVLLKTGLELTQVYIRQLVRLGVAFLYVEDEVLPDIEVKDVIAQETRSAAVRQIKNILFQSKESGQLVIKPKEVYFTVSEFTSQLLDNDSLMYNLVDLRSQDDYTFAHSVNVAVLALMTGVTLGLDRDLLSDLGVGAMLHDLGKVRVPDSILNKPGKLTAEEFRKMQEHTTYGYKMIQKSGTLDSTAALVAYQHHEAYDGSGYPLGILRDRFHEFAQITAIADKFDALTADRIYRPAFPSHEAYEMCAASGNLWFSDHIVRAFLHNIAAYPTGTWVELGNGMIAVVVDTPKGYSLFPRVRVIAEKGGRALPPFEVFLHERTDLHIARIINPDESSGNVKILWKTWRDTAGSARSAMGVCAPGKCPEWEA